MARLRSVPSKQSSFMPWPKASYAMLLSHSSCLWDKLISARFVETTLLPQLCAKLLMPILFFFLFCSLRPIVLMFHLYSKCFFNGPHCLSVQSQNTSDCPPLFPRSPRKQLGEFEALWKQAALCSKSSRVFVFLLITYASQSLNQREVLIRRPHQLLPLHSTF